MKAVKIIIGLAGGVYAVLQVRELIGMLQRGVAEDLGTTKLLACVAGILLGAALCIGLLQNALRKRAG